MRIRNRFFDIDENVSFFLLGPRGTEKSTWCRNTYGDELLIDLLQPDERRAYISRPERLRELAHQQPDGQIFVIDEVQKVPELLTVVHSLIEEHRHWRFVLTGSSARKLRHGGTDLMAGRALWKNMHPYMAAELGEDFSLERAMTEGLVPIVVESSTPQSILKAYAGLYLESEVHAEGMVRNLGSFARFLEVISFSHGQALNVSNVARECQIERTTVAGYVDMLEELLLAYRLPVFAKRAKRATASHSKFYYFDTGVYRSLRPTGPLDAGDIAGPALEGLVGQHLRAWIDYGVETADLYYWRTRAGSEVDFIVYGETTFVAIEVKNSTHIHSKDTRGLRSFCEEYPEASPLLLYRGSDALRVNDIPCLPCEAFLKQLTPNHPLVAPQNRST